MIIYKKYENKIEKCWYDSTNVIYSECLDKENDYKELKVVFKDGRTYLYKDVDVNDYLLFSRDVKSIGSALNKYIISKMMNGAKKYPCEKIENTDVKTLIEERNLLLKNE